MGIEQLVGRVHGGESLRLLCHCYPLLCHGDSIKREIIRRLPPPLHPGTASSADATNPSLADLIRSAP